MKKKLPKLIILLGPTASGKTNLVIKLAKKFNGEIVNADSRNVYRGMYIGTASPFVPHVPEAPRVLRAQRVALRAHKALAAANPPPFRGGGRRGSDINNTCWKISGIPHHLFHYIEPWEAYSVGRYKKDAIQIINDIITRGKTPILVGGTGLYIWSVVDNLAIPQVPPNPKLRERLMKPSFVLRLRRKLGLSDRTLSFVLRPRQKLSVDNKALMNLLWDTLIKLDPEAAKFVQKDNPRRVIRALEVILWANKSPKRVLRLQQRFGLNKKSIIGFSDLRRKGAPLYNALQIGIKTPFSKLDKRIDARVDKQIKDGLVKETKRCHSHILKNVRMTFKKNGSLRDASSSSLRAPKGRGNLTVSEKKIWAFPSMTSLGYRQIGMFLRGSEANRRMSPKQCSRLRLRFGLGKQKVSLEQSISLDEAIRILKHDTRRYARRQMTWLRRDKRIKWLGNKEKIEQAVDRFLKKK